MRKLEGTVLLTTALSLTAWTLQHGQEPQATARPLTQYTIGDLFPRVDARLVETAEDWKVASAELHAFATTRGESVAQGLISVRQRTEQLEADLKAAKRSKDFTAEGAARGALETEEAVLGILKRLSTLSDSQRDVADAWIRVAQAMEGYVIADDTFDPYRSRGIAKPTTGAYDDRMDPAGVDAFRKHAQAMDELGKSFERLGAEIQSLVGDRKEVLSRLEKGGHLQTPPMPLR